MNREHNNWQDEPVIGFFGAYNAATREIYIDTDILVEHPTLSCMRMIESLWIAPPLSGPDGGKKSCHSRSTPSSSTFCSSLLRRSS